MYIRTNVVEHDIATAQQRRAPPISRPKLVVFSMRVYVAVLSAVLSATIVPVSILLGYYLFIWFRSKTSIQKQLKLKQIFDKFQ